MLKFITIDERGDLFFENETSPVVHMDIGHSLMTGLNLNEQFQLQTTYEGENYIVESFDFPLLINKISITKTDKILLHGAFETTFTADPGSWSLNELDQFCGSTEKNIPFKLSAAAQAEIFNLCDSYDDDSFTINGITINTPSYFLLTDEKNIEKADFWNQEYKNSETPAWDLKEPAIGFQDMIHRLKLPKSKILVLGCGNGHDASLFADAGHVVTAVDFSSEAIENAKKLYGPKTGQNRQIEFIQADVFNLPSEWNETFDLVVEHTLFCAIHPKQRKNLIKVWKKLLHEEGQLISVFFTMFKRSGPPFGSTEFELRALLKEHFQFLFWGRLRNSTQRRMGKELFVLGKKK